LNAITMNPNNNPSRGIAAAISSYNDTTLTGPVTATAPKVHTICSY